MNFKKIKPIRVKISTSKFARACKKYLDKPINPKEEQEKKKQLEELGFETVTYPDGRVEIATGVARGDSRALLRITNG